MKHPRNLGSTGAAKEALELTHSPPNLNYAANTYWNACDRIAKLEDAIEQAFGILNNIPEDPPENWSHVNASIQEAQDIIEVAKLEKINEQ